MYTAIWQEAHWKALSDETYVGKDSEGNAIYNLAYTDAKIFWYDQMPLTLEVVLFQTWEEKTSEKTGNKYYIGGAAKLTVFWETKNTKLFAWIGKDSQNKYMNASFGNQDDYRVWNWREVAPVSISIFEDNWDVSFGALKRAKMKWIEIKKKENAWKIVLNETYIADEAEEDTSDEVNFADTPAGQPQTPVAANTVQQNTIAPPVTTPWAWAAAVDWWVPVQVETPPVQPVAPVTPVAAAPAPATPPVAPAPAADGTPDRDALS